MKRKAACVLLAFVLALGIIPVSVGAKDYQSLSELKKTYLAMDVEAYNLGLPHLIEPSLVEVRSGSAVKDQFETLSFNMGVKTVITDSYYGPFLKGIAGPELRDPNIPGYLKKALSENRVEMIPPDGDGFISSEEYTTQSGWMFTVDHVPASQSFAEQQAAPGSTVRFIFSVYGWGSDMGISSQWSEAYYQETDKSDLIYDLAAMNSYYGNSALDYVYENALAVANDPYATAASVAGQVAILEKNISYKVQNGVYPSEDTSVLKPGYGETFKEGSVPGERPLVLSAGNRCFITLPDKVKKTVYSTKGVVTVNGTGAVTAKKAGRSTATITLKNGSVLSYTFIVEQPLFPKKKTVVSVGETVKITDLIEGLTYTSPDYFIANNPDRLYVDPDGCVTGVKKGSASVRVFFGAKSYRISFTVS